MKWTKKASKEKPNGSSVDAIAHHSANQSSAEFLTLCQCVKISQKAGGMQPRPPMESEL